MIAKVIIEQFDNGISIKWEEQDQNIDPVRVVALERDIYRTLGEMVWDSIKGVMDHSLTNGAEIRMEYYPKHIKDNEQE